MGKSLLGPMLQQEFSKVILISKIPKSLCHSATHEATPIQSSLYFNRGQNL